VERLFRQEYGKLISILTGIFGPSQLELVEDIVQETLIAALDHWSFNKVPDKPTAWLVQVAKRKALNELKRNQMIQQHHAKMVWDEKATSQELRLNHEIEDSQLRMIFTCCSPLLSTESQITLTLKTLCGLGSKEIAKALLTSESNINKRLYRAKETIREHRVEFHIPSGADLEKRLKTVALSLYLLFNEGYNSSTQDETIRKDLCLEAIRLTQLLVKHFKQQPSLSALLAMMCLHSARFDARLDDHGAIILFENQDRSLWNGELIKLGMFHLKNSIGGSELTSYHIEANIAALHCSAPDFEHTDWPTLYRQYELLYQLKPNPILLLNLAIINSRIHGLESSLTELEKLYEYKVLKEYHLLPATQAMFYMELKDYSNAIPYFEKALALSPSPKERERLTLKLNACQKQLPLS
jgi:RNA polymerase sigma-70 factor (ECF subfamily)